MHDVAPSIGVAETTTALWLPVTSSVWMAITSGYFLSQSTRIEFAVIELVADVNPILLVIITHTLAEFNNIHTIFSISSPPSAFFFINTEPKAKIRQNSFFVCVSGPTI